MMLDRIKLILKEKGLQSSSFADEIQVSRGTISHILNGRNDPSKSTIDKILKTFPDISTAWFLSGKGPMYKHEQVLIKPVSSPVQQDIFDEKQVIESSEKPQENKYAQKKEVNKPENETNSPIIQNINLSNNISKKIDKIIIFFTDKTYMTFISEE